MKAAIAGSILVLMTGVMPCLASTTVAVVTQNQSGALASGYRTMLMPLMQQLSFEFHLGSASTPAATVAARPQAGWVEPQTQGWQWSQVNNPAQWQLQSQLGLPASTGLPQWRAQLAGVSSPSLGQLSWQQWQWQPLNVAPWQATGGQWQQWQWQKSVFGNWSLALSWQQGVWQNLWLRNSDNQLGLSPTLPSVVGDLEWRSFSVAPTYKVSDSWSLSVEYQEWQIAEQAEKPSQLGLSSTVSF